jgi:hypothetical protein
VCTPSRWRLTMTSGPGGVSPQRTYISPVSGVLCAGFGKRDRVLLRGGLTDRVGEQENVAGARM